LLELVLKKKKSIGKVENETFWLAKMDNIVGGAFNIFVLKLESKKKKEKSLINKVRNKTQLQE
jgi:hypothetical protein